MLISMQNRALYAFPVWTDQLHSNGRKAVLFLSQFQTSIFKLQNLKKVEEKHKNKLNPSNCLDFIFYLC